jgi:hypothetical protein
MNVTENLEQFSKTAQKSIDKSLKNPYIMAFVKLSLVIYAVKIAPRLPQVVEKLLENTFVKIILLAIMVYLSEKDFQLALIIGIVYVLGMNFASGRSFLESFSDYSSEYKAEAGQKLIEPKTAIYPGCLNMTMADLEKAFEGDFEKLTASTNSAFKELLSMAKDKSSKEKLMQMAYVTGLPYNLKLNDENAPYIATILLYRGADLGNTCAPPK